jgi:nitrite reductase (cytochrome c-552)
MNDEPWPNEQRRKRGGRVVVAVVAVACVAVGFGAAALLTNIFERKREAKNPYLRLVDVSEETTDPAAWGVNWPRQLDGYKQTADVPRTRFGGSETLPDEKIERDPGAGHQRRAHPAHPQHRALAEDRSPATV